MLPLRLMGASSLDQETEGREAMVAPVRAVLSTLRRDSVDMIGRVYRRSGRKRRNYFCAAALTQQCRPERSEESLFLSLHRSRLCTHQHNPSFHVYPAESFHEAPKRPHSIP